VCEKRRHKAVKTRVTNVKYSGNEIWNIGGHTAGAPVTGNGIVANRVDGGELSFNLVHKCGG
jgi:hypothetical protein